MENRNKLFAAIYLVCAVLGFIRGGLAILSAQSPGVAALRFSLGILFLVIGLLYSRRE